jgi:hypothetical protein
MKGKFSTYDVRARRKAARDGFFWIVLTLGLLAIGGILAWFLGRDPVMKLNADTGPTYSGECLGLTIADEGCLRNSLCPPNHQAAGNPAPLLTIANPCPSLPEPGR